MDDVVYKDENAMAPCPWCRIREHLYVFKNGDDLYSVVCDSREGGCGGAGGLRKSRREALRAWNNRLHAVPVPEQPPSRAKYLAQCALATLVLFSFNGAMIYLHFSHIADHKQTGASQMKIMLPQEPK